MRAYRMLGLLIATAMALILAPAAARAEPYPAQPPASTVSEGVVNDDDSVVFSGKGFLPFEKISVTVSYGGSDSNAALQDSPGGFVLAALPERRRAAITVTATAQGTFSIRLKLSQLGDATLVATGLTSGVTVQENVTVVDTTGGEDHPAGGALPLTGSDGRVLAYTLYGGLGAVLIGAGAIWLARTRRRTTQ